MTDRVGRILLVISGGIAAYKSLELIRLARAAGIECRCILTRAATQFVTSLSVAALSENPVHSELFSPVQEAEMGHIQLSRWADLVVVAPASADLLAKMAAGLADDLASTALLATDKPVLVAPAMNVRMWMHAATQANIACLRDRGIHQIGPEIGGMACNETGPGRMAEPADILAEIQRKARPSLLAGRRVLVTAGPTREKIDPVRYLTNGSSGLQGYAIALALAECGADTVLVSGPTELPDPVAAGLSVIRVTSAAEMYDACLAALPVTVAVCVAAVADWRVDQPVDQKLAKRDRPMTLTLVENADILASLAEHQLRPTLLIGFAAETHDVLANARMKLARKGCDWILANHVKGGSLFGARDNEITLIGKDREESWPRLGKGEVGRRLAVHIVHELAKSND